MQYLYEKLQRHNLVTMRFVMKTDGRPDLGFHRSYAEFAIACVFLPKARGGSYAGLPQAAVRPDEDFTKE
jgi:hypothetical protein